MFPSSSFIIRVIERQMGRAYRMHGREEKYVQFFQGKRPLGRRRHRREDNIEMNLSEIGWEVWTGFIWIRTGTSGGLL
jgi:hypothetical protein